MTTGNKHMVILGAGESGVGSAVLAQQKGFEVWVSDSGRISKHYKKILTEKGIPFEEGKHSHTEILKADKVMKSPGIPDSADIILKLKEKEIPVVSEIEFASEFTNAKLICVTGSNGKTTTTNLIFHIMKKAGLNVEMAGNVGKSFALLVAEKNPDYFVLELSSFQLDGVFKFKADIAVLLNITPDHLDRYEHKMQNYINSKFRIIRNQNKQDYFIFNDDDPLIIRELNLKEPSITKLPFTLKSNKNATAYIENEQININHKNNNLTMSIYDLALKGKHNIYNSMAAGIAGEVLRIRKETIRESLSDFQGVEHRLEPVIKVHGIQFINDSKATNVNSTWYALESMEELGFLSMCGVDKG
jgi:UDP-N-acetylmuramoylalanine--D-glutamate ligase